MERDKIKTTKVNMKSKILIFLMLCHFLTSPATYAAVLWAGGENVDFPTGGSVCNITSGSSYRAGYARHSIYACDYNALALTNVFNGGAVTNVWLSARIYGTYSTSDKYIGLAKSGTNASIWIGNDSATGTKLALWKYNGTTWTKLATESGATLPYTGFFKADMQIINYGSSATVNIYINGQSSPLLTFTGDVTEGGATSLDRAILRGGPNWSSVSEIIVADTDTRNLSLVTLAPNAAGDSSQWSGAYTNINSATINDASNITTATTGQTFQANLLALPTGNFEVLGVKLAARSLASGAGIGSVALGVKTNATVSVPAAVNLPVTWGTIETLYLNNPVTVAPWSTTEINALQINFESGN